jgi:hypothetical protein
MATFLPPILADQMGAELAGIAVRCWPQIMACAREGLVPWIDRNTPELAAPVRLAYQDLDMVADGLRSVVRIAWRRLRSVLIGQTAQFVMGGSGEWAVRITSCLRTPAAGRGPAIELVTEQELDWKMLPEEIRAAGLDGFGGASIVITRTRVRLLSDPA